MLLTQHSQELSEFQEKANEILNRLNLTGEAEVLTVNGEARAILLSPSAYEAMAVEAELSQDVASIQRSIRQIENGQYQEASVVFAELREELLARKNRSGTASA